MAPVNSGQTLFTCLSCSIAFTSADEQRVHYRSDFHRYNMKRRVAALPPVSLSIFEQKMSERTGEAGAPDAAKDLVCQICSKNFSSQGAYQSHLNSKKHKEAETKSPAGTDDSVKSRAAKDGLKVDPSDEIIAGIKTAALEEGTQESVEAIIDQKIAAAKEQLSSQHCLFCPTESSSFEDNLSHMSSAHSFFIPDADYLINIEGLITYLGEKIAVGNVCIFCNERGREFRSMDAVRKHMIDKSHCKIAYSSQSDRLEISDYYDFSTSYPMMGRKRPKKTADEEWEDADDDDGQDVDEIVDEEASDSDDSLEDGQLTYGDSPYELVLPSGARIGHRTMRRYYAQSFRPIASADADEDPNSGRALVRRLLSDKNSALVPRKGGYGAYGQGTDVIKARNRGEAREAGRHVKEFRDQRRREDFKTKVGFIANSQKHFRDPLLQ